MAEALGATSYELRNFFLEKTTELRRRSCPEFDNTTAELFKSSCSAERFKNFWKCVRVSRESHMNYALGPSSIAQPFCSLCTKVFDEHPTVATPKEQKFCAATSQNHSVSTLDTPAQINFNSTVGHKCARTSIDHHRRRPTSRNTLWASVFKNTSVEVFATHAPTISSGLRAIDTYEQSWLASNSLTN